MMEIAYRLPALSCYVDFGSCRTSLNLRYPVCSSQRKKGLLCVIEKSYPGRSNYLRLDRLQSKGSQSFRLFCSLERNSTTSSETFNSYVLDGEEGRSIVAGKNQSIPKISIRCLPDEAKGDKIARISSCFWEWKPNFNVHYETSGSENVDSPGVLFLPGFGAGSFHYEKQLKELGCDYRVWALDFLGQGRSLPSTDPTTVLSGNGESDVWGFGDDTETWAKDLVYSVDLWKDQVRCFIEEVIKEPVYIVGNSLGGFVALYIAACYPELVRGVTLLNATPFWGLLPNPARSPRLSRFFPWAGTFPFPSNIRRLVEALWQKISDPKTVAEILKQVYADHSTNVDEVFSRIIATTQHPAAAAAFASIMFAPQAKLSFNETLSRCQDANIPICLMYGKEDPWVRPIWGLHVKRKVPNAPYYQISPAGHCPHDEVAEVVNFLLRGWIKNVESDGKIALPLVDSPENVDYDSTKDLEFTRGSSKKSIRVQYYGATMSLTNWINSNIKSLFKGRER